LFWLEFFLPKITKEEEDNLADKFAYITSVKIREGSKLIGKKPYETEIWDENDIRLIKIQRGKRYLRTDLKSETLQENDILWLDLTIEDLTSKSEAWV